MAHSPAAKMVCLIPRRGALPLPCSGGAMKSPSGLAVTDTASPSRTVPARMRQFEHHRVGVSTSRRLRYGRQGRSRRARAGGLLEADPVEHHFEGAAVALVRELHLVHVEAQLTASIAHEVNQPLSGIITNASTCLRMAFCSLTQPDMTGSNTSLARGELHRVIRLNPRLHCGRFRHDRPEAKARGLLVALCQC